MIYMFLLNNPSSGGYKFVEFVLLIFCFIQVSRQRDLALYLSNLPGNTTQQKVEALLEMEADCNLDEACLMKVCRSMGAYKNLYKFLGDGP